MKIALLADIHGNYAALQAVLQDIERQQPDQVFVLGDLVFKGPEPARCVEAVQALGTVVIRGNIDELVGSGQIQPGFAKSSEHEAAIKREMEWTRGRLSEEQLHYLAHLPFRHEVMLSPQLKLQLVHANPRNILDSILPDSDEAQFTSMFEGTDAQITAYAHIHLPYVRSIGGRTLLNTGSVGLPFDGDTRSSYALIEVSGEDIAVTLRRVRYDVEETVRAYNGIDHPFASSVIEALRNGSAPR